MNQYYMIISNECISCQACTAVCPSGAIYEGDSQYFVDPNICNAKLCLHNSGIPCESACPISAIEPNGPIPVYGDPD